MGYLKGRFQSLRGLRQNINSNHDYLIALTWVRVALIIHSFALEAEHEYDGDDFWEWVQNGLVDDDDDDAGDAFVPVPVMPIPQESEGQLKRRQVQQALFDAFGV
jgi:hypothetical protein